jgi:nicotinate phosphoribosyltransferase
VPRDEPPFSDALLTDLYALTMMQAYVEEGMNGTAVFSLFVRQLPERRNYLLACGLEEVLAFLERLRFDARAIEYLASLGGFSPRFLAFLEELRFTGDVYAVPEGTPVFAGEPLVEIEAPIAEAQLVEAFVINEVQLQTMLASKAARVVAAAAGRPVVDFGLRRMQGTATAVKAARAFYIAGVESTSNVAAGQAYGLPVAGTMAHSYVQAHETEREAFRAFAALYPGTVLLVDTYDTLDGVRRVIDLTREMGGGFHVGALRLDSGDLSGLSRRARQLLDEAGLRAVGLFASGGLDEDRIADLVAEGAPFTGFGVGTDMGVSRDAPALDMAYKLVEYGGRPRIKLSPGKVLLPGRKQVTRVEADGVAVHDIIGRRDERPEGRGLLRPVMVGGRRQEADRESLEEIRARALDEVARLPRRLRALAPANPPYDVNVTSALREDLQAARRRHEADER